MLQTLGPYIGHTAGMATSLLWTATSLFFTAAAQRIGPVALNAFRLTCAVVLLGVTHRLVHGYWVPDTVPRQVVYLGLSGLIGLTIGDQALFTAFLDIGPRLAMLIMTTSPLVAVLLGWIVLGEQPGTWAAVGIVMTVGGVAWVVLERPERTPRAHQPHRVRGIVLAMIAAACQAGGLMLSKVGMGHGWLDEAQRMDPQAATLVRMVFAALAMTPVLAFRHVRRRRKRAAEASRSSAAVLRAPLPTTSSRAPARRWASGLALAACGSVVGPFLGVWMSLVASDRVDLGTAQTLCSLSPVFILPFAAKLHKERIGPRAVLGAILTVAGVAALVAGTG